jgi:BlaI family transcriptional regulator, penicillinase repressor
MTCVFFRTWLATQIIHAEKCALATALHQRINPHMPTHGDSTLSKRENQAMEIIYRLGTASAAEVHEAMPDAPNYSSVRSLLAILVEKALLKQKQDGKRYLYEPALSPVRARKQALGRVVKTFFSGSPRALVASLLDPKEAKLSKQDVAELRKLLDNHPSA